MLMNATALRLRFFGDPILRKKAIPVKHITENHHQILNEMAKLMYEKKGMGLAALQVGINESMIVVDVGSGLYKLINPKILKKEGLFVMEEGCLSIPSVSIKVKRAKKVKVKAQDEDLKSINIEAEDLLACCLQHEIDHLKGRLIVDYASMFEKLKIRKKLKEIKRKGENERLPESKTESFKLQL